jgi:hypothetical protein
MPLNGMHQTFSFFPTLYSLLLASSYGPAISNHDFSNPVFWGADSIKKNFMVQYFEQEIYQELFNMILHSHPQLKGSFLVNTI